MPAGALMQGAPAAAARRSLWVIVWIAVLDVVIGGGWDAEWHRTQPFDGFFSPPHLFIYTFAALAMALTARLVSRPDLHRWFGPRCRSRARSASGCRTSACRPRWCCWPAA
jgi:hypothetical protein